MPPPEVNVFKKDGAWTVDGRPRETLKPVSHTHPPNIPGKSQIILQITMPPNGATPPHTHGGASVTGLMIKGKTLNQMNEDPSKTYETGESWYESPGCRHFRSENVSDGEDASFYAVMIIEDDVLQKIGMEGLFSLDADKEEQEKGKQ